MRAPILAAALALGGCVSNASRVGILGADAEVIGVKLLHPGAVGRSCRAAVLGIPLRAGAPSIEEALGQILELDSEGNVVTHAEVGWQALATGLYNRRCVEVRGDLGRALTTVALPAPAHHHGGHP